MTSLPLAHGGTVGLIAEFGGVLAIVLLWVWVWLRSRGAPEEDDLFDDQLPPSKE